MLIKSLYISMLLTAILLVDAIPVDDIAGQRQCHCTLTDRLKRRLENEAPETLKHPERESFINVKAYDAAIRKFLHCGHWASWMNCPSDYRHSSSNLERSKFNHLRVSCPPFEDASEA